MQSPLSAGIGVSSPRLTRIRPAGLLLGVVVLVFWRGAAAQERGQDNVKVQIVLAGDAVAGDKVLPVLRDSLARQGVDAATTTTPRFDPLRQVRAPATTSPADPWVHVWLDLVGRQPAMYLVSAASELVYVRPLAVHAMPDAVEIELIRFVVDSSVRAILQGRALGVSRDQFEQSLKTESATGPTPPRPKQVVAQSEAASASNAIVPAPAPTPPPEAPEPQTPAAAIAVEKKPAESPAVDRRWAIGGGYSGVRLASGFVQHGPQVTIEWRRSRLHLGIALMQTFPVTVARDDVSTHLTSTGARLFAALPVDFGSGWAASVGLGAGMDTTHVSSQGNGATPAFWVSDPLARARAVIERLFTDLIVAAEMGLDWDFLSVHYNVTRAAGTVAVWTPARLRPYAALRLGFLF